MDPVLYTLQKYFGHASFRPGQEALVRSILSGRDTLGILPTGGGKSICYQVPALLFSGITLVVSPLISLMADQVEKLNSLGIPAACLTSAQTAAERRQIIKSCFSHPIQSGTTNTPGFFDKEDSLMNAPTPSYWPTSVSPDESLQAPLKFLYLSPERLLTEEFRATAVRLDISFVCVDEAHCVSQWGENFRPAYRRIPEFLALLPKRPALAAFTATATPSVRRDIETYLRLRHPFVTATGFDRPNLFFRICRVRDKWPALLAFLAKYRGLCGIVYCLTRRTTESVAQGLCHLGIPAACYHGALPRDVRDAAQAAWLSGEVLVMCATCAFGMGIDKPNVRFVIHYQMSGSVENYYQEAGRAGRDGKPSDCVLLYSFRDVVVGRFFANRDTGEVRKNELRRLLDMRRYAASRICHRAWLLRYFGETAQDFCGKCSFCLQMVLREQRTPAERALEDEDLRKELRALRLRLAQKKNNKPRFPRILHRKGNSVHGFSSSENLHKKRKILPYKIFPDEVLYDLSRLRPTTRAQFLLIENANPLHVLRYGRPFLEEIRVFEETR